MSGAAGSRKDSITWIPTLDTILPSHMAGNSHSPRSARIYESPDSAAIVAASLAAALAEWPAARVSVTLLRPVSERGHEAVEELEAQTVKLLSFQPLPKTIFDSQIAFNLSDRYGESSAEKLPDVQARVAHAVRAALPEEVAAPAVQIIQAPVFFGYGFTAFVEFDSAPDLAAIEGRLAASGFDIRDDTGNAPSNVNAAGEGKPLLAKPQVDANRQNGVWLWGVADNVRLAAANALAIAERVLAS
jgi:aspartate-semialdehyde dehydrogenase